MQVIDSVIKYTGDFFMGSADVYTLHNASFAVGTWKRVASKQSR